MTKKFTLSYSFKHAILRTEFLIPIALFCIFVFIDVKNNLIAKYLSFASAIFMLIAIIYATFRIRLSIEGGKISVPSAKGSYSENTYFIPMRRPMGDSRLISFFNKNNIKSVNKVKTPEELRFLQNRNVFSLLSAKDDFERYFATNSKKTVCIEFKNSLHYFGLVGAETKSDYSRPLLNKIYISVNNPEDFIKELQSK